MIKQSAKAAMLGSMSVAALLAANGKAFAMQQLNCDMPEIVNIHPAILPVDSQAGANNGLVVSLKGYAGALVCLFKKAGTAGDDPVFTMTQASAIAGTGEKALTKIARVYSKLHATTVPGVWTRTEQTAAATFTDDTSAEKSGLIVYDVKAEDLDRANGFDCIRLAVPDTGSAGAQLLCAFYVLYGPRNSGIGAMASPLVD